MHSRTIRHSLASRLALALSIWVVMIGLALADKVDDLIKSLKDSDNKVRLSAALSLGKLGDKRAIVPLTGALTDPDKTVRGVAAASLGKLVDSTVPAKDRDAAIDALEKAAKNDPDSFVRSQAQKSFDVLKGLRGTGGGGGAAGLGGKTIYVEIVPMTDASGSQDPKVLSTARAVMEKTLNKEFATKWPGGKSPSDADLKKAKVKGFSLSGTVNKFEVKKSGKNATVTCWVSMIAATFPANSAFGFANNKKAEVDTGSSDKEIAEGKVYCVEALVEGLVKDAMVPAIKARP